MHGGVDFAVPKGTPVKVTGSWIVTRAGWQDSKDHKKGFGQRVTVDHGNGNTSTYGHLDRINVTVGQPVKEGEIIGRSGNTGKSTGAHLHYEEGFKGKPHPPTFNSSKYKVRTPNLRIDYS
jgi:murein DD-endopeptidase MepM/ murein hydrolase activator NlpD